MLALQPQVSKCRLCNGADGGLSVARIRSAHSARDLSAVRTSLSDATLHAPENMAYGKYHRRMFMRASYGSLR